MSTSQPTHRPLVKRIQTKQGYYVYDARTNRLLRITPAMNDILASEKSIVEAGASLKATSKHSPEDIEHAINILTDLTEKENIFRPGPLECRQGPICENAAAAQLQNGAKMMTLEVTDACNMRCTYCIFSGGYPGSRSHGSRKMGFSVAKAAVDFYRSSRKDADDLSIGFYGGEPLLDFELIKQCCDYVLECEKSEKKKRALHFSLTTNGTLLTEEMITFFMQHGFSLTISLDGPREIHDQYRILANGKGTFDIVMKNLQRIYDLDATYYRDKMLINCVLSPSAKLSKIREFFEAHKQLFSGNLNLSDVSGGNEHFTETHLPYEGRDVDDAQLENEYCLAHVSGKTGSKDFYSSFVRKYSEEPYLHFHRRNIFPTVSDTLNQVNTCFPGERKVFIDVEGQIHMCERVYRQYPIGDVWNGYDIRKVTDVFNQYSAFMNSDECKNCWAVRMCPYCFTVAVGGEFPPEMTGESCTSFRQQQEIVIANYCAVLEQNPKAFDYMNDYEIA